MFNLKCIKDKENLITMQCKFQEYIKLRFLFWLIKVSRLN
jgi:hypothetical protein